MVRDAQVHSAWLEEHIETLGVTAGDFEGDYDLDAVRSEWIDTLSAATPDGVHPTLSGWIYYPETYTGPDLRNVVREAAEGIDVAAIMERHEKTTP